MQDTIGRTVMYTYDASGRLWKVTDPENVTTRALVRAVGKARRAVMPPAPMGEGPRKCANRLDLLKTCAYE